MLSLDDVSAVLPTSDVALIEFPFATKKWVRIGMDLHGWQVNKAIDCTHTLPKEFLSAAVDS
jgi:hypothetical protein